MINYEPESAEPLFSLIRINAQSVVPTQVVSKEEGEEAGFHLPVIETRLQSHVCQFVLLPSEHQSPFPPDGTYTHTHCVLLINTHTYAHPLIKREIKSVTQSDK